jgi:hypothetical protein
LVLLVAALASAPATAGVFSPYSAVYEISRDGLALGQASYKLSNAGNDCYLFEGVAKPLGLATLLIGTTNEQSRFCVNGGSIRSQHYEISREGGDKDDNYVLDFDWSRKTVETKGGEARALPADGLDPMVLQLAVRKQLKESNGKAGDKPLHITIVENNENKEYDLAVTGEEDIKTEIGNLRTIRIERVNDRKRQLRFWLAPSLDYLPVRVERQKKDDSVFRMRLLSLPDSPAD